MPDVFGIKGSEKSEQQVSLWNLFLTHSIPLLICILISCRSNKSSSCLFSFSLSSRSSAVFCSRNEHKSFPSGVGNDPSKWHSQREALESHVPGDGLAESESTVPLLTLSSSFSSLLIYLLIVTSIRTGIYIINSCFVCLLLL